MGHAPRICRSAVLWAFLMCIGGTVGLRATRAQTSSDPFKFFRPTIALTPEERQIIDRGQVLVRIVPGQDNEIAVFAAVALKTTGEALVKGVRQIEQLKKGPFVLGIRRLPDQPAIHHLDGLVLDDEDLEAIRDCRPGNCKLKLSAAEMRVLKGVMMGSAAQGKPALQGAFRRLTLERVRAYLARGHEGIADYEDDNEPVDLQDQFSALIRRSPYLLERLPQFARYLEGYPKASMPGIESFLYWSKETLGGKPVISVTHVGILRGDTAGDLPEVLVAGKQVFATHYTNASLNLTAVLRGTGSHNYLVFLNRSRLDVLGGVFGWLKRSVAERRLKDETAKIFQTLRERLEAGARPAGNGSAGSQP